LTLCNEDAAASAHKSSPSVTTVLFPRSSVLITSTHRNSTIHLWALSVPQPTCLQSIAFTSETKEFLGHLSFDPSGNFLFLASVKLCVGFIIHLDAASDGRGTHSKDKDNRTYTPKFDYLTEFEVTQPILSFTVQLQTTAGVGVQGEEEHEEREREITMQLFCVQTKAIQLYQTTTEHCYSTSKQSAQEEDEAGPINQIGRVGELQPSEAAESTHTQDTSSLPPLAAPVPIHAPPAPRGDESVYEKIAEEYSLQQQQRWLAHSVETREPSQGDYQYQDLNNSADRLQITPSESLASPQEPTKAPDAFPEAQPEPFTRDKPQTPATSENNNLEAERASQTEEADHTESVSVLEQALKQPEAPSEQPDEPLEHITQHPEERVSEQPQQELPLGQEQQQKGGSQEEKHVYDKKPQDQGLPQQHTLQEQSQGQDNSPDQDQVSVPKQQEPIGEKLQASDSTGQEKTTETPPTTLSPQPTLQTQPSKTPAKPRGGRGKKENSNAALSSGYSNAHNVHNNISPPSQNPLSSGPDPLQPPQSNMMPPYQFSSPQQSHPQPSKQRPTSTSPVSILHRTASVPSPSSLPLPLPLLPPTQPETTTTSTTLNAPQEDSLRRLEANVLANIPHNYIILRGLYLTLFNLLT
jgi:hypothetical protein